MLLADAVARTLLKQAQPKVELYVSKHQNDKASKLHEALKRHVEAWHFSSQAPGCNRISWYVFFH